MTLTELQALSDKCGPGPEGDRKFLADPLTREAYYKAMGSTTNGHVWKPSKRHGGEFCSACGFDRTEAEGLPCSQPVGSLADAAEELRAKVAEKWDDFIDTPGTFEAVERLFWDAAVELCPDKVLALEPARICIMVFLCALGAVEVEDKNG
jgi:hypothetical protein